MDEEMPQSFVNFMRESSIASLSRATSRPQVGQVPQVPVTSIGGIVGSGVVPKPKPTQVQKKKTNVPVIILGTKEVIDEEALVGVRWTYEAISNILNLYEEILLQIDKDNLKPKHWTYLCTEHHRHMPLDIHGNKDATRYSSQGRCHQVQN